jgi:NAD(P)H dehydrogenase (quinone)
MNSSCTIATGGLWATGQLAGKYAGVFTSCATQHGGHETTYFYDLFKISSILTTIPFFAHQGMLFVPLGYTSGLIGDNSEMMGGSPW